MTQFVKVYLWLNIFDVNEEDEYAHMPVVNATLCDPQKTRQREAEDDVNTLLRQNLILSTVQTYALPDGYSVELDQQGVPAIFHNGSPCCLGWDFDEEVYLECGENVISLQLVDL